MRARPVPARAALALTAALTACLAGCKKKEEGPPAGSRAVAALDAAPAPSLPAAPRSAPVEGAPVAAGSLRDTHVFAAYAVLLPAGADAAAVAKRLVDAAAAAGYPRLPEPDPDAPPPDRGAAVVPLPAADVFDVGSLDYKGRGLAPADVDGLRAATDGIGISLRAPVGDAAAADAVARALARDAAVAARGWVHDPYTAEVFTVAALDGRRPAGAAPHAMSHINIHMVQDEGSLVFLETRGLARFGVPELIVRRIPQAFADDTGELVNAAADTLLERGAMPRDGTLDVDAATLATGGWRALAPELVERGGAARMTWTARWTAGATSSTDAPVSLIELDLPPGPGERAQRVHAAASAFLGATAPEVTALADDDPAVVAARKAAMAELAALAPRFADGIPEQERLIVKAPFATDDGSVEWMWVEVQRWTGPTMTGVLINQPLSIAALKAGATVEVKVDELFDYVHDRADGTSAGGKTDDILTGDR